ncbi:unnamed protein product [Acanthoscelides obtectus]|uniref:Endonuclease/exonuclease/phosphatase domain-containing protein n=1 Tax=Acanthoscelides obtectus TaxID=200917 RepID=A0A9P0MM46_ACAOB|nr:unnamed protein product [Acanthoscelides obtectus]CAK1627003.1 Probable RNA-directed DNA polymerase from transposon BS [Acanthoscelides obtectus]
MKFKEITCRPRPNYVQVCGAEVQVADSLRLSLLSMYVPPSAHIRTNEWIDLLSPFGQDTIVGGDLNAHHSLWGSYKQDHNGCSLVEALNSIDWVLMNDGSSTRLHNNGLNSVVDLTFSSPNLANIIEWKTHVDTLGSDHYPILLEMKSPTSHSAYEALMSPPVAQSLYINPSQDKIRHLLLGGIENAMKKLINEKMPLHSTSRYPAKPTSLLVRQQQHTQKDY